MLKELLDTPSQTGSFETKNTEIKLVCQISTFLSFLLFGDKDNWIGTKYFHLCGLALSKVNTILRNWTPHYQDKAFSL